MKGISTQLLHTGYAPNKLTGDIIPPIHISTTFKFGNEGSYDYSRSGNPTRAILEATLAALDGMKYGLAFSSGSAVLATVVASLRQGEEILFSTDAYGGTYRYIVNVAGKQNVPYHIVDLTDPKKVDEVLKKNSIKYIWLETPSNPLMKVADIGILAKLAHRHGAFLIVDNTFASPVVQQPALHGADIVVYSTTKYMNGHSDVVGGALLTSTEELYTKLKFLQNAIGAILSPFDSWLTLRGLRTLELRMERHVQNATHIAQYLSTDKRIKKVFYPGLATGDAKRIVKKQMKNGGGMLSIEIDPKYDAKGFLNALHYFPLAESLGGVESLIDHPASMTHASIPKEEREKIGLTDGLLRISVGIENGDDLIADLKQAIEKMGKGT
ncbi:MAG: PLP-dependent aspartate aminotransferase family protein [Microgenomates group bacterium]